MSLLSKKGISNINKQHTHNTTTNFSLLFSGIILATSQILTIPVSAEENSKITSTPFLEGKESSKSTTPILIKENQKKAETIELNQDEYENSIEFTKLLKKMIGENSCRAGITSPELTKLHSVLNRSLKSGMNKKYRKAAKKFVYNISMAVLMDDGYKVTNRDQLELFKKNLIFFSGEEIEISEIETSETFDEPIVITGKRTENLVTLDGNGWFKNGKGSKAFSVNPFSLMLRFQESLGRSQTLRSSKLVDLMGENTKIEEDKTIAILNETICKKQTGVQEVEIKRLLAEIQTTKEVENEKCKAERLKQVDITKGEVQTIHDTYAQTIAEKDAELSSCKNEVEEIDNDRKATQIGSDNSISSFKKNIKRKDTELIELNTQIVELNLKNNAAIAKIERLENELKKLEDEKDIRITKLGALSQSNTILVKTSQSQIRELELTINKKKREAEELNGIISKNKKKLKDFLTNHQYGLELVSLINKIDDIEKENITIELTKLERKLKEQKVELKDLKYTNSQRAEIELKIKAILSFKKVLLIIKESYEKNNNNIILTKTITKHTSTIREQARSLVSLEKENEQLKKEMRASNKIIDSQKGLSQEMLELQNKLETERKNNTNRLQTDKGENKKLKKEKSNLQALVKKLEEKLKTVQKDYDELSESMLK